jgi:serine/threonine-protein kinase
MRPQLAGLLLVTGICAGARTATADGAADVVVARTLFADARTLADAGHYEEACPKFEESRRLLAGVGTIYNLADCYEHVGRTASAWATFLDAAAAAASAGEGEREKVARTRAAALEPRLTRLRIRTNPADSALPGLTDCCSLSCEKGVCSCGRTGTRCATGAECCSAKCAPDAGCQ